MQIPNSQQLIRRVTDSLSTAFYGIVVAVIAMGVAITWLVASTMASSEPSRR